MLPLSPFLPHILILSNQWQCLCNYSGQRKANGLVALGTQLSNAPSSGLFSLASEPHHPSVVWNKRTILCDILKSGHQSLTGGGEKWGKVELVEGAAELQRKESSQNHCFLSWWNSCGIKPPHCSAETLQNADCWSRNDSNIGMWNLHPPVIPYKHKLPWQLSDSEYYPAPPPDAPCSSTRKGMIQHTPLLTSGFYFDFSSPFTPSAAPLSEMNLGSKCINNWISRERSGGRENCVQYQQSSLRIEHETNRQVAVRHPSGPVGPMTGLQWN